MTSTCPCGHLDRYYHELGVHAPTMTPAAPGEPGKLLGAAGHAATTGGSNPGRGTLVGAGVLEPDASRVLLVAAVVFLVGFWGGFVALVWLGAAR